ncbi:MAG: hypothetical protein ACXW2B_08920 [Methylomagnum sp.]
MKPLQSLAVEEVEGTCGLRRRPFKVFSGRNGPLYGLPQLIHGGGLALGVIKYLPGEIQIPHIFAERKGFIAHSLDHIDASLPVFGNLGNDGPIGVNGLA